MGMDKCHIADYEQLVSDFERIGLDKFASRYIKCDALVGDSHAITFIENKITEYYGKIKTRGTTTIENS